MIADESGRVGVKAVDQEAKVHPVSAYEPQMTNSVYHQSPGLQEGTHSGTLYSASIFCHVCSFISFCVLDCKLGIVFFVAVAHLF